MKPLACLAFALGLSPALALAQANPMEADDGLHLPPGFHASVVAEGLGRARHIAVRDNGDLYISTLAKTPDSSGVIALRLTPDHKVAERQDFGTVSNGTGIRFYNGALYAASPTAVYRFRFHGRALAPEGPPQIVVQGLPSGGFPSRGLALDGRGHIFVEAGASSNICLDPAAPKDALKGLNPCPSLAARSGVWRFDASKDDQAFPADGEQVATGVRDMMALDWSPRFHGLYGLMQGRNDHIDTVSEELHRIDKGANLGWPYTYYDTALNMRVLAPEYGGDGKAPAPGNYDAPLAALPAHQSPLDLVFYDGRQFPVHYRGGAFIVYHGGAGALLAQGHRGYDVAFLPFDAAGKPQAPEVFADGFAGPDPSDRNPGKAAYRPTGAAVAPDGSLYVVEGEKGRLWRISYEKP
jgi:glucose/arabinose dehydrogenase